MQENGSENGPALAQLTRFHVRHGSIALDNITYKLIRKNRYLALGGDLLVV